MCRWRWWASANEINGKGKSSERARKSNYQCHPRKRISCVAKVVIDSNAPPRHWMRQDDPTRPPLIRFAAVLSWLNIKGASWITPHPRVCNGRATGEQDRALPHKTPPERLTLTSAIKESRDQKKYQMSCFIHVHALSEGSSIKFVVNLPANQRINLLLTFSFTFFPLTCTNRLLEPTVANKGQTQCNHLIQFSWQKQLQVWKRC